MGGGGGCSGGKARGLAGNALDLGCKVEDFEFGVMTVLGVRTVICVGACTSRHVREARKRAPMRVAF